MSVASGRIELEDGEALSAGEMIEVRQLDRTFPSGWGSDYLQSLMLEPDELRHYRALAVERRDWAWTEGASIGAPGDSATYAGDGLLLITQNDDQAPFRGCPTTRQTAVLSLNDLDACIALAA